jgi:hypothetical protein
MKLKSGIILLLIGFSFLVAPLNLSGQNDPLLRIEIDVKSDAATYKLIPVGELGFVMFYETTITQDDYQFWIFVAYNKFMQEIWKKDVPVFENMSYRKKAVDGEYVYLLYHDIDKKKSEVYNYQILKINVTNGKYELFSGEVPDNSRFVEFGIFENFIIAGLDTDEEQSGIYSLNMLTKETEPVFEYQTDRSKVESIYIDTLNNTYLGVFNVHTSRSAFYYVIKEFNANGEEINSIVVQPEENKKLNTGKLVTVNSNERLLIGTYDFVKGGSIDRKDYFSNDAIGFYSIRIVNNEQAESNFYNFLNLENMTGYLKSREYQMAKKKAERSDDDPDKHSLNFDLLLHEIIQKDSMYYFITEAYYEEYHTVTSTYYDYYGHPVPVSYSVFDGYKYFNTFISCFDQQGNKIWDNGMEIFDIISFNLVNRSVVYFLEDEILLAYNRDGKIGAKIIDGAEVVEGVEHFPLETNYVNDKIIADTKSNLEYWYDNYFIAYGFQTIRNNSLINKNKRVVFYVNKVAYE